MDQNERLLTAFEGGFNRPGLEDQNQPKKQPEWGEQFCSGQGIRHCDGGEQDRRDAN